MWLNFPARALASLKDDYHRHLTPELHRLAQDGAAMDAADITPQLEALERDTLNAMSSEGTQGAVHLAAVATFATD